MTLKKNLLRLFAHFSVRRRRQLSGLIFLMLLGALAEMSSMGAVIPFLALLANPNAADKYPNLYFTLNLLSGGSNNKLLGAAILFGTIAIGAGIVRMTLTWASLRFGYGLGADIGREVYSRTLNQPYSWHVARNSSEIIAGIEKVNAVVYGVITPLLQGSVALIMSIGILCMLLIVDIQAAIIASIGFTSLYALTSIAFRKELKRNDNIISENATRRIQSLQEGLGGIRDVLLDGTQSIYLKRFAEVDYAMRKGQASNSVISASPRYVIEALGMILIILLALWLSDRQGGLTAAIPILGALAIGAQKLLPQMQLAYFSWASIHGTQTQLNDVLEFINFEKSENKSQITTLEKINNNNLQEGDECNLISLANVCFRYSSQTNYVLKNINLNIKRGDRVGFIGKTGCGKSTLIDIIMGLLDPSNGYVEIEGLQLNDKNKSAWQKRIAHVPQSIYLSDMSVAENIAFGVEPSTIDLDRVKASAMKAQIADFIDTMPNGYKTIVGERGVRLSGGQRQRIGLARALYKKADVLFLDEATSALDTATEKSIINSIQSLGNQITVLMIAHRFSTLENCNMIVELENAQIHRVGSCQTLLPSPSFFN